MKQQVKVQKIRVGVAQGYDKSTANKGKFVTSDAQIKCMKKRGEKYKGSEQYN